jgi:hypothetical protein
MKTWMIIISWFLLVLNVVCVLRGCYFIVNYNDYSFLNFVVVGFNLLAVALLGVSLNISKGD